MQYIVGQNINVYILCVVMYTGDVTNLNFISTLGIITLNSTQIFLKMLKDSFTQNFIENSTIFPWLGEPVICYTFDSKFRTFSVVVREQIVTEMQAFCLCPSICQPVVYYYVHSVLMYCTVADYHHSLLSHILYLSKSFSLTP